jgi:hypothetical protein
MSAFIAREQVQVEKIMGNEVHRAVQLHVIFSGEKRYIGQISASVVGSLCMRRSHRTWLVA